MEKRNPFLKSPLLKQSQEMDRPTRADKEGNSKSSKESIQNRLAELEKLVKEREQVKNIKCRC